MREKQYIPKKIILIQIKFIYYTVFTVYKITALHATTVHTHVLNPLTIIRETKK